MPRPRPLAASIAAILACILLTAATDPKPTPDVPSAVRELQRAALADRRAYATLQSLTTQVGNRFAGSENDAKAVAWALETLRAQGFSNVRAEPVTVPRWVRGEAHVQILGDAPSELTALALGGSVGTGNSPIEADVLAVTTIDELERLSREKVIGKIVFFYDRMIETRDGMDYGPTVKIRSQGAISAAKLGAVGVVIRAVGSENADRPHTGAMRYANGVPRIPALAIGNQSADRLLDAHRRGPVRLRLASSSSCQGVAQSANVIGEIPGRDAAAGNAEEFVLLGAHLDSWDVGTGAQDDGAGIVTVVEAARRIGEMPERPRRSLRVVLYANEEFGLSGGRQYALEHEATLSNHVGAIESDMGSGRAFRFESRVRTDELKPVLRIGRLLAPLGITFEGNDASGGADIGPLRERGVPVFELQQDASKYFEIHHTAADLMDRVDGRDLAFNVAAYATVAWGLAEEAPRLAWNSRKWPAAQDSVHACEWQP
jgi:hypothetical protein